MLCISRNNISLTKGDSAQLVIRARAGSEDYEFSDTDVVVMSVALAGNLDGPYLFQKQATITTDNSGKSVAVIDIIPTDTQASENKDYKYDVRLNVQGDTNKRHTLMVATLTLTDKVNRDE